MNFKIFWEMIGLNKATKEVDKLKQGVSDVKKGVDKVTEHAEEAASGFGQISGITSTIKYQIENIVSSVQGFKKVVTGGLTLGFKGLIDLGKKMALSVAPYALALGAIAGIFLVLRRMFKLNVGGMQTKWTKFIGAVKDMSAKFILTFDKLLKALGPVFDVVFGALFFVLTGIAKTFSFIFDMLNKYSTALKVLAVGVALYNTQAMISFALAKIRYVWAMKDIALMGVRLGLMGAITAAQWALNFAMSANPIGLIIIGVAALITGVVLLQKKFNIFGKYLEYLKDIFSSITDIFTGGWSNAIQNIIKLIAKMVDVIPDFLLPESVEKWKDKTLNENSKQIAEGNSNNTNNNKSTNNNIVFNTSREINKNSAEPFADILARQLSF